MVLPSVFQRGQKTILLSKTSAAGEVEVALYSSDGKTREAVLHRENAKGSMENDDGLVIFSWDGSDPAGQKTFQGPYRIRWTMLGQYRELPITIRDGMLPRAASVERREPRRFPNFAKGPVAGRTSSRQPGPVLSIAARAASMA
jgi:hypothetical protein